MVRRMPLLAVDVASMSEPNDDNQQDVVLNCVDDSIVAYPDTKAWPALEGPHTGGSRILCEQRDRALDATTILGIELAQRSGRRRTQLDAVVVHSQPRSALTCSHGILGPSSAIAASKATTSSASSSAAINCS